MMLHQFFKKEVAVEEKTLWDIHAHFKWTFESMGTEHTADHFNIPANGLQMLEEFIAGYTSVPKEENKNY